MGFNLFFGNKSTGGGGGITGSGTLQATTAALSGVGLSLLSGSGVLQALTATLAGVGESIYAGAGVLSASTATLAGTGLENINGSGILQASTARIAGFDVPPEGDKLLRNILSSPIRSILRDILS